ncbi:27830_t:CDS:2 [Gigaspora margarita]|uniref:27830_t:CDS:1 n=1 Tax=Gigaspora margarita TaxID=4874 RepID=A0ABN7V503_GIGMA|nr:27830_t:CDS:2 [Gigaspora margarita]
MTNEEISDHLAACPTNKETWKQLEEENTPNERNSKTRSEEKIRKPGPWKQSNQPYTTIVVRGVDNELPGQNLERQMRANHKMGKRKWNHHED